MYSLRTESSFDAAHFLSGYDGECAYIHGHRWRVIIEIQSENIIPDGTTREMVVDFGKLKEDLKTVVDCFDHSLIVEDRTLSFRTMDALKDEGFKIIVLSFRPTAENFAKYFYDKIAALGYRVRQALVYETPNNCATYFKE